MYRGAGGPPDSIISRLGLYVYVNSGIGTFERRCSCKIMNASVTGTLPPLSGFNRGNYRHRGCGQSRRWEFPWFEKRPQGCSCVAERLRTWSITECERDRNAVPDK
jgi:hypothetical protein